LNSREEPEVSSTLDTEPAGPRRRVLWLSTAPFTLLFAVWLMLGVLGIRIKQDSALILGPDAAGLSTSQANQLAEARFEWLLAAAILSGSLLRLNFGIWADRYGGRNVMIALLLLSAVPTYWLSQASSYSELLLCAILFGLARHPLRLEQCRAPGRL
jgi:MFS transporter, NNP family, nitrate/nitrite transporter